MFVLVFTEMVSDASKKKAAQKKAAAAAKRGGKSVAAAVAKIGSSTSSDNLSAGVENLLISDRTCTGVLCSHPLSRDIRVCILVLVCCMCMSLCGFYSVFLILIVCVVGVERVFVCWFCWVLRDKNLIFALFK